MRGAIVLSAAMLACAEPVQVYILMGQSNMLGMGEISGDKNGTLQFAVHNESKYQYLLDSTGGWATFDNLRNVFIMGSGNASFEKSTLQHNEWMTVKGSKIGPELGIGHKLHSHSPTTPTMLLKSCIGNRALGWDLLPPGSPGWDYTDSNNDTWTYAGYHQSPNRWKKGTTPQPIGWEAGEQYDGDTNRTHHILNNFQTYFPGADGYKVAGFFWWQGDKDSRDASLSDKYEEHLVYLIKYLRKEFNAPDAKFVTASLGQTVKGDHTSGGGKILDAMLAVDGRSGKYPDFKGNVQAVYTHPLSMGSSSGSHYGGNAETYMNIGEGMGDAMVDLLG